MIEQFYEPLLSRTQHLPDYYHSMYKDGYEPWEIIQAKHNTMLKEYIAREQANREAAAAAKDPDPMPVKLKITTEVKHKR